MAYTVWNPLPLWTVILARLRTSTGEEIGEGIAPAVTAVPYGVFYPQEDDEPEGSLSDPLQAVTWTWQVTAVGEGLLQAGWMQHKVRLALVGWTPTITGVGTYPVHLAQGSGIPREDPVQPPLFFSTDRFSALTSI